MEPSITEKKKTKTKTNKLTLFYLSVLVSVTDVYADTLHGTELGSSLWGRTSLLNMIRCATNDQLVDWYFFATYAVAVLIETQVKVNC